MVNLTRRFVKCTVFELDNKNNIISSKEFSNINSKGYRIDFAVTKYPGGVLNKTQIRIFNLTDATSKIINKGNQVILEAGYGLKNNIIFKGRLFSISREKFGADIITTLYCSQQGTWSNKTILDTISRKPLGTYLDDLANSVDLDISRPLFNESISKKSFMGDYGSVLDKLGNSFGFEWHIDDETLIIKRNDQRSDIRFVFNPSSGLLKSPIVTENGINLKIFLEPFIKPYDEFELDSRFATFNLGSLEFTERIRGKEISQAYIRNPDPSRFSGNFIASNVIHEGSTHNNEWSTTLTGLYPDIFKVLTWLIFLH